MTAAAALALAALPACSGQSSGEPTAELEPGGSRLSLAEQHIPLGVDATCTERPDGLFLISAEEYPNPADPEELQGFEVLLANDRSQIRRVIAGGQGMLLMHDKDGSLSRDDDTYTVSGVGLDLAASDSLNDKTTREFEITVRCP